MKTLTWDDSLSVQIEEIDQDHRRLIELFNLLNRALSEGDSRPYIEALLDELISCTIWHFKHEERLMLKHGYEEQRGHQEEHQELAESALALQQQLQQQNKTPSSRDIEFLEGWLTGHILGADMELGAYLAETM